MKQNFISILLLFCSANLFSQCLQTDSTVMGANYANDVFYSMKNGTVKTESNTNWHMAFSVQGSQFPTHPETGVSVRVNSIQGNVLVKLNGANAANWRKIDTTGLSKMPELLDSFKTWDFGGMNKGYNITTAPFNFIWGAYNQSTYNVNGSAVYALYNKKANIFKKIFIKSLDYDSMWNVIISNIDNSDSVYLKINKKQYPNRLFAYYDIVNKQVNNREPAKTDWDIVWTRYKDLIAPNFPYPLTGILMNKNVTVAKNIGKKCNEVWPGIVTAPYLSSINNIGYDWKIAPMGPGPYILIDTFVYFVKPQDGKIYKIAFNGFTGASGGFKGKTFFSDHEVFASVDKINNSKLVMLYPNPATDFVTINTFEPILKVEALDITGSMQTLILNNNTVDVSCLTTGMYMLNIQTASGVFTQKILKD